MKICSLALLSTIPFTMSACDPGATQVPKLETAVGVEQQGSSIAGCPSGYECVASTEHGGVTADAAAIGANCPEACDLQPGGEGLYVIVDADPFLVDSIAINCPNNGLVMWPSSHGCWDCMGSCAGANCPPGKTCLTIPGRSGSDCRAFSCSDASYTIYERGTFQEPICVRPASNPPAAPSVSATTYNGHPRLTWSSVAGAAYYRVYRQLEWMSEPDVWYSELHATTYTDISTNVTGSPHTYAPSGQWARYHVVAVNAAGESGESRAYYYTYSGIAPY